MIMKIKKYTLIKHQLSKFNKIHIRISVKLTVKCILVTHEKLAFVFSTFKIHMYM